MLKRFRKREKLIRNPIDGGRRVELFSFFRRKKKQENWFHFESRAPQQKSFEFFTISLAREFLSIQTTLPSHSKARDFFNANLLIGGKICLKVN
jgi:hypothetical protein